VEEEDSWGVVEVTVEEGGTNGRTLAGVLKI